MSSANCVAVAHHYAAIAQQTKIECFGDALQNAQDIRNGKKRDDSKIKRISFSPHSAKQRAGAMLITRAAGKCDSESPRR